MLSSVGHDKQLRDVARRSKESTQGTFQKWASCLHEKPFYRDKVEEDVWIMPAPFCGMCYVKDEWKLPGHELAKWSGYGLCTKTTWSSIEHALQVHQLILDFFLSWT